MAQKVDPEELHRIVASCLVYRMRGNTPEFLIKQRASEEPFPDRWEAGAAGGLGRDQYDAIPPGLDGQAGVGEYIAATEVDEETGLAIGELIYLGTFRCIRPDGIPVFGIRYFAQALSDEVRVEKGIRRYLWVTADEAREYDLIGQALEDMCAVTKMLEIAEIEAMH